LSNKLQNYLSAFCKKFKMESSNELWWFYWRFGAREKGHNKLLYYKAIPSTKNVSDFNPTVEKQHLFIAEMKT
jgi:hypothetical protein